MEYISTRGYGPVSFTQALLDGLAPDGGLYVPASYPHFDADALDAMAELDYVSLAEAVMLPFVEPDIDRATLRPILEQAYQNFADPAITPLRELEDGLWLLELFHGPTLAFKDIALQVLGLLLDHALAGSKQRLTVLGATSGDTGPAAIEGLKGRESLSIVMLYPHGRVSDVQRRQMTTTGAANVHPVAVEGTFDDCQRLVKALFNDASFRAAQKLTAINSISWARLLPQMVYYFYAWGRLRHKIGHAKLSFAVPTGNFGDIFAGYAAHRCGLPLHKLIIANNQNDILTRFVLRGDYSVHDVAATQSPSIDILVASNFERYLFDLLGRDSARLRALFSSLAENGKLPPLSETEMTTMRHLFTAHSTSEAATTATMHQLAQEHAQGHAGLLVDPHTAVGLAAAHTFPELRPIVALATAHPAKFGAAVERATGQHPPLPEHLADLLIKDEHTTVLPVDENGLKAYIRTVAH